MPALTLNDIEARARRLWGDGVVAPRGDGGWEFHPASSYAEPFVLDADGFIVHGPDSPSVDGCPTCGSGSPGRCGCLSAEELDELDPGIRHVVVALRAAGWHTTDSGDGVSKPKDSYESGEALPYPHVAIVLEDEHRIVIATHELQGFVRAAFGPDWTVEATYHPDSRMAVLLVMDQRSAEDRATSVPVGLASLSPPRPPVDGIPQLNPGSAGGRDAD